MLWAIVAGLLAKGVTSLLLFYSYNYISSGMSTTLHFMYPLFAALLGYLFFRDRLPIYKWVAIVAATLAVVLMGGYRRGRPTPWGVLYAVLSAVVYAAYILVVDKGGVSKIDPMVFAFYLAVSGSVFSLAFGLSTGSMKWSLGWETAPVHAGRGDLHLGCLPRPVFSRAYAGWAALPRRSSACWSLRGAACWAPLSYRNT